MPVRCARAFVGIDRVGQLALRVDGEGQARPWPWANFCVNGPASRVVDGVLLAKTCRVLVAKGLLSCRTSGR